jgi:hypothetical protein
MTLGTATPAPADAGLNPDDEGTDNVQVMKDILI